VSYEWATDKSWKLKFHSKDKANAIADCLENQFTPHDRRVEARVQALLEAEGNDTPDRIRPCDLRKLLNSLKLRKACGIDGILNECLRLLPRRPLVHLMNLINHCIWLSHFPTPWKEAKVVALPKPGKDPKFPQNLHPINLTNCPKTYWRTKLAKYKSVWLPCTSLQCMRLADHVTLNFNNNISTSCGRSSGAETCAYQQRHRCYQKRSHAATADVQHHLSRGHHKPAINGAVRHSDYIDTLLMASDTENKILDFGTLLGLDLS
jgi:hypothetical protein